MKLNLLERVMLISILPEEANFVDLRIVNELKQMTSFTEKDIKEYGITTSEDHVNWDPTKSEETKDIDIGARGVEIVSSALKKLDEEEKLTSQHFTLYEKFVANLKIK